VNTSFDSLQTPCLILHQSRFDANVTRLYEKCKVHKTAIRPHLKTAKSVALAKRMQRAPMTGITVSTLHEAEYFYNAGFNDILYAVTIAPNKIERAVTLATKCPSLILLIDNVTVFKIFDRFVQGIKAEHQFNIRLMIEIDVDGHRAGLLPNEEELLALAQSIVESRNFTFCGLMTHAGESYTCQTPVDLQQHAKQEVERMQEAKRFLQQHDIKCPVLSIGSTPTANAYENLDEIDEIRAGVFVFYDLVMTNIGVCTIDDIALGVLSTVISHKKSHNRVIIDAGGLALSKDRGTASQKADFGYGLLIDALTWIPIGQLVVNQANQEHGVVYLQNTEQFSNLPVGAKVIVLPNHACMTAAAHSEYHVFEDGRIIDTISRINGW